MPFPERGASPDERGMALAVAVFVLAVMSGLVGGTFVAGFIEQQSGRNTLYVMQAAEASEAELQEALLLVPASTLAALPIGGAAQSPSSVAFPGLTTVEREVLRLTGGLFLIRTRASRVDAAGTPLATRTLGLLVKLTTDSASTPDGVMPLTQRPWVQLY
jgi:hypothetical protein